ncbi:hypothetical protein PA08_1194 [Cutibacterium modestum P08]|nr:hypothetical protein PA08_1194 [Cutibacterium modestum P08]
MKWMSDDGFGSRSEKISAFFAGVIGLIRVQMKFSCDA